MADNGTLLRELASLKEEMNKHVLEMNQNNDAFFLLTMALIIFLMQCGFAFLEAGAVRSKNTTNIIFKNVLDSLFAIVCYWSAGWALAYGPTPNKTLGLFFGQGQFFLIGFDDFPRFFFQYVFAATCSTIVGGAVAERCEIVCYLVYCVVISMIVYPVLTHWGWADGGWMKNGLPIEGINTTYVDFAGAGVVHLCGGIISIVAAYIMGPRIGRFPNRDGNESVEIKGHSVPFAALGGLILIFGFLAFNGGSTGNISTPGVGKVVGMAMVNTIMSGAFAAITYLTVHYFIEGKWTLLFTINATLAGMVSACSACDQSQPIAMAVTGVGAGLVYLSLSKLAVRLRIDDPLDAFAVHAGGGSWGLVSACFLKNDGIIASLFHNDGTIKHALFQLLWTAICAMAISLWSAAVMAPIFVFLKKIGKLRVPEEVEVKGLDIFKHGEAAYPLHAYGHGWDEFETLKTYKKASIVNPEISLEQLASAYLDSSEGAISEHKKSVYYNPQQFEHPEHTKKAQTNRIFDKNRQV